MTFIRCEQVTLALGGEGYLNFMGNEFGHPEWIDFPRDDTYDPSTGEFVPGAAEMPPYSSPSTCSPVCGHHLLLQDR